MKVKAHIRVAKDPRGRHKIAANLRPSRAPLTNSVGVELPTVAFAVMLEVPDSEFTKAEQVIATLEVKGAEIAAQVREVAQ